MAFEAVEANSARPEKPEQRKIEDYAVNSADQASWRKSVDAKLVSVAAIVGDLELFQGVDTLAGKTKDHSKDPQKDKPAEREDKDTRDERSKKSGESKWDPYEALTEEPERDSRKNGKTVQRNIEPSTIAVSTPTNSEQLALRKLGAGIDKEQVERYAHEIAFANGMEKSTDKFRAGDLVRMPGHKEDGTSIFIDTQGTRFTERPDGTKRVEYKDKTGYEEEKSADGTTTRTHFGPKDSDSFQVKTTADGKIERTDTVQPEKATDLAKEKAHLLELADSKIGLNKERSAFKKDMEAFEERARKEGLPPAEVAQTYHEIGRLLEANGNQPLNDRSRVRLAVGVMRNSAEPTSNDQGGYQTCNVMTIENRLYTREPSVAAKVVADVGLTGKYTAYDGTHVTVDKNSLSAHGDATQNGPRGNNERGYASQIFQVAAVNVAYAKYNEGQHPPTNYRYVQHAPTGPDESGEKTIDYSSPRAKIVAPNPALAADMPIMAGIEQSLTGKDVRQAYLHSDAMPIGAEAMNTFKSPAELGEKLAALKEAGHFPVVIGVRANNPIFGLPAEDLGHPLQDGHVILITDYDKKTGMIKYDNQWGNDKDRIEKPLLLDEFYQGTNIVSGVEWMKKIEAQKGKMGNEAYAETLASAMTEYKAAWYMQDKQGRSIDEPERTRTKAKFDELVAKLPARWQKHVQEKMNELCKEAPEICAAP